MVQRQQVALTQATQQFSAMIKFIKQLFEIDKRPRKGLLALEWVMLGYLALTLLIVFFTYTKAANPNEMIWGRVRILAVTAGMWAVYRMLPCRLTLFLRITVQMALLSWWYPDTYEINRMLPNLDHLFARWEQDVFGCQPALLFHEAAPWPVVSELMSLGYAAYYPMIIVVVLFYFLFRYKDYGRAAFVVTAAFFIYYLIYIVLPVTGPTFYYKAVGLGDITAGVFPNVHDYFNYCQDCFATPGYEDGVFYQLVESAKAAGERPTAAFPSSHVGISTILMMLVWRTRNRRFFYIMLPLYVLLCLSTVYIQAHYAIDVLAGWATGAALYFVLMWISKKVV